MAQLPIYTYGAPVLREKTRTVRAHDDEVIRLIVDMFETMHKASGVGLAANQVGQGHSVCIVDLSEMEDEEDRHEPLILINPLVIDRSDEEVSLEEGCLSIPSLREEIRRPEKIRIKFRDGDFEWREIEAEGFLSRVIQHEVDHLNGVLFTDHVKGIRKKIISPQLKKMQKGEIEADYPLAIDSEQPVQ